MEKILVTGANGFLAGNIIIELLKRNYLVTGMLRSTPHNLPRGDDFTIFNGNITDPADVAAAVEGCDAVIHCAALTSQSVPRYSRYEKINVDGTRNVILASRKHRIKKLVYVSTANVFGYGTRSAPGNESLPMKKPFDRSLYAISKARAQEMVLNELSGSGIKVTVVNPAFMIGPNDWKISSNRIILRALGRRILLIPPGGKNFIHVADAAAGICNALENGEDGQCYILANENLSYREFYRKMKKTLNINPMIFTIPAPVLFMTGLAGSLARCAGITTEANVTNMRIISTGTYYSAGKSVRELQLPQTPVEKAIKDTAEWFEKK